MTGCQVYNEIVALAFDPIWPSSEAPNLMRVVLAEKPSVARELASFLGATARHDGYFEGRDIRVTWALGHLATLKEPQDYDPALKRWSLDTLPIRPRTLRSSNPWTEKRRQASNWRSSVACSSSADELICATDAGREGELIFRYILELTGCEAKPARRLWLSSLTRRGDWRRLRSPPALCPTMTTLYAAARCRSEADWVVGLNATRYHTVKSSGNGSCSGAWAGSRPRCSR